MIIHNGDHAEFEDVVFKEAWGTAETGKGRGKGMSETERISLNDILREEQPRLTCADLARITGRPAELFQRLARAGKIKAYRDSHGEKTPYRFKESEFAAFWADFQKEIEPWQGITSFGKKAKMGSHTAHGGRARGARAPQTNISTAKQSIKEARLNARMTGSQS